MSYDDMVPICGRCGSVLMGRASYSLHDSYGSTGYGCATCNSAIEPDIRSHEAMLKLPALVARLEAVLAELEGRRGRPRRKLSHLLEDEGR